MPVRLPTIAALLDRARKDGREHLLEPEGLELLRQLGLRVPRSEFIARDTDALPQLAGDRVVLKAVGPQILHKTELGAVQIVPNHARAVAHARDAMLDHLVDQEVTGFLLQEFVPYRSELGHELLLALRWAPEFGPTLVFGLGGVHTELLQSSLEPQAGVLISSIECEPTDRREARLRGRLAGRLATQSQRGLPPLTDARQLSNALECLSQLAALMPAQLRELEINPLVVHQAQLWALDVLCKLGGDWTAPADRPREKLPHLLRPNSVALMGVSTRDNPGHVILRNLLEQGFDPERIFVVKPGMQHLDGCPCVPDLSSLPMRVDALVLAIEASQAAAALTQAIELRSAESIVLIPGGFEETEAGKSTAASIRQSLTRARASDWRGPLINGGNCLGIRSLPGRFDTIFIPQYKIGTRADAPSRLAIVAQSGAFAVSKRSKLSRLDARYAISVGNQLDLTIGDYLEHLAQDTEIRVFAVYVEGFRELDGLRFLRAARAIHASGRRVVLYRGGRNAAGSRAAASHSASMAGDYATTLQLAQAAGVLVAASIEEFEDLVTLADALAERPTLGRRLGALTNAGFECVAIADNLGPFTLAELAPATKTALQQILRAQRLEHVVDVHNPLDLTPQMGAAGYVAALEALLEDASVDWVLCSCVPLTPALHTVPASAHGEDLEGEDSLFAGLRDLRRRAVKPFVAAIDGGTIYDPFVDLLMDAGIPSFRSVDRAMRACAKFAAIDEAPAR